MFILTDEEFKNWKSQIVISNSNKMGLRKPPLVFTEQGVAMLSSVLNSDAAVQVNIKIIRVFTRMREMLMTHKDLLLKMEQIEKTLNQNNEDIELIFNTLRKLISAPKEPIRKIGYKRKNED